VLLDADVIIDLHRLGIWDQIKKRNSIRISSIILRQEVYFYKDERGYQHPIDLLTDAGSKFQELSIDARAMPEFVAHFDRSIREMLHLGEIEALCLLQGNRDLLFCTSDKMAIKVIALMGSSEQGISFERLLKTSGITKRLENKHSESYFKRYLKEGSIMRIQGAIKL
jgi:hypothetical protein